MKNKVKSVICLNLDLKGSVLSESCLHFSYVHSRELSKKYNNNKHLLALIIKEQIHKMKPYSIYYSEKYKHKR